MSHATQIEQFSLDEANQRLSIALARQADLDAGVTAAQSALRSVAAVRANLLAKVAAGTGTTSSAEVMEADTATRHAQIDLEIATLTARTGQQAIDEAELARDRARAADFERQTEAADEAVKSEIAAYATNLQAARDSLNRVIRAQEVRAATSRAGGAHNAVMLRKRPNDSSVMCRTMVRTHIEFQNLLVQAVSRPFGASAIEWNPNYLPS